MFLGFILQALDSIEEKLRDFVLKTISVKLEEDTALLVVAQKQDVCC